MAIENISVKDATGAAQPVATDVVGTDNLQVVKLGLGADGSLDNIVDAGQQLSAASVPVVLASDHSDVKVTLDSEAVVLGAGTAAFGKLAANSGVDIGDVDVLSLPALAAGTNTIGSVKTAENGKTRVSKRVAVAASQTGATIWDPTTSTRFVITKLWTSAKTAGDIQIFDGTDSGNTVVSPIMSLAAGGGFAMEWPMDMPYRSAAVDNILKFTTGTGITGSIYVEGWEE